MIGILPTKIVHPYERAPIVTLVLLGANVVVFVASFTFSDPLFLSLALNPEAFRPHQLLTSGFLHNGFFHLLGNLLFLGIYGRYVEERLGHLHYLAAYFAFELVADLAYLASGTSRPSVGASGAISGLMGFVFVAAPWVEVEARLIVVVKLSEPVRIAALWLLLPWLLLQIVVAMSGNSGPVAVTAHLGGFLAGAVLAGVLRQPRWRGTSWYVDPAPPGGGEASTRRLARARAAPRHDGRRGRVAAPVAVAMIRGVDAAPSRVALAKLLMARCGMAPEAGMSLLAAVAKGTPASIEFSELAEAEAFAQQARDLGAAVDVTGGAPSLPTTPEQLPESRHPVRAAPWPEDDTLELPPAREVEPPSAPPASPLESLGDLELPPAPSGGSRG